MNIVVTSPDGSFYSLEVSSDLELENLLVLVSVESGKPTEQIQVQVLFVITLIFNLNQ